MQMQHLRLPGQVARQMGHAFGKKNKPLRVVRIIRAPFLIKPAPLEKRRLLNEIDRQSRRRLQGPDFGPRPAPAPSGKSSFQSKGCSAGKTLAHARDRAA